MMLERLKNKGFTLIEVLIAVTLLSIILGALYSTFFLSERAMGAVDESLLKLRELRTALDTIGREVEAVSYSRTADYTAFRVQDRDIYGKQASRFSFSCFSPLSPGLSMVSYYAEETDGRLVLFKKVKPARPGPFDDEEAEIMEDIREFSVEVKSGDRWVRTWDAGETGRVPEEIRVSITVSIKGRELSLYETLRPKIGRLL
ncbi:MAG: prepilin-type N-terminal cleavage/methylation domain-containing protein [Thermodesulfovibrionales bacterium]|nr:prepilin-type N-terminal cleavage/methylation domain-containing protein [Thermodesulfovibrionales bacterium]